MIDLHCHILPGIDDGAGDLADSVGMARQGAADGIEAICATPHIRHDHDVRIAELAGRVAALNRRLAGEDLPIVVLQGGEVAETAVEGLDEDELALVTLGAGRWVLLEPAPGPLGDSLERCVEDLHSRGRRVLIAHPERHVAADMFERLARLVDHGALIQMTADYLLREQMAEGLLAMAGLGLVHVLSSDSHSSAHGRPVALTPALERLRDVDALRPHIDWIAEEAPHAIVEGLELEPPYAVAL
ncbi:MAG TPA: CpsB/CapC family capsule biosynthesis tyrosine phosphatase [Solirubrobacterales bacterium]